LAPVRRRRHRGREVGDDFRPLGPTGALESDEPVVREDQELPLLQRVVDLRVRRARGRLVRDGVERAAGCTGRRARRRRARAFLTAAAARGEEESGQANDGQKTEQGTRSHLDLPQSFVDIYGTGLGVAMLVATASARWQFERKLAHCGDWTTDAQAKPGRPPRRRRKRAPRLAG